LPGEVPGQSEHLAATRYQQYGRSTRPKRDRLGGAYRRSLANIVGDPDIRRTENVPAGAVGPDLTMGFLMPPAHHRARTVRRDAAPADAEALR
jgi:hypothetical protein